MGYLKEDVYSIIKEALVSLFKIEEDKITLEARLYEELDIDSIDAVDLLVYLKEKTGKKPDAESFRDVRSVGDVVDAIYKLLNDDNNTI